MVTTELKDAYTLTITREQLPLLNDCLYAGFAEADVGQDSILMDAFRDNVKHQLHNQPAVPAAEVRATVKALRDAVEAACELDGYEDFSPDADYTAGLCPHCESGVEDPSGVNAARLVLYAALTGIRENNDLARIDAWLAQQEGRDGNG